MATQLEGRRECIWGGVANSSMSGTVIIQHTMGRIEHETDSASIDSINLQPW